jgi:hypothetical protein
MAWSDLASNQMVSYTDAQGGGFTLQSGQSPVTSNQCMTKNDALTKYVLDSSYMSGYASNQLVPKSTWVSGVIGNAFTFDSVGNVSGTTACAVGYPDSLFYSDSSSLVVGSYVYTDIGLTTTFNGSNLYYYVDNNGTPTAFQIQSDGYITNETFC